MHHLIIQYRLPEGLPLAGVLDGLADDEVHRRQTEGNAGQSLLLELHIARSRTGLPATAFQCCHLILGTTQTQEKRIFELFAAHYQKQDRSLHSLLRITNVSTHATKTGQDNGEDGECRKK